MSYFWWQMWCGLRIWLIIWRVFLRALLGKSRRDKLFSLYPEIDNLIKSPIPFFPFVRPINGLIQVKLPDGILIQPKEKSAQDTFYLNQEIYVRNIYNKLHEIQEDDVVVDIGAHIGIFTLKAARKAKKGLVIAIEPYPPNFELLTRNIKLNRLEHTVVPLNIALASYNGKARLYIGKESGTHSISSRWSKARWLEERDFVEVTTKTLDSVIKRLQVKRVDFIKIDAEAAELNILKGAEDVLKGGRNLRVAIAAYHFPDEVQKVSRHLLSRNFKVFTYKGFVYGEKL